MTRSILVRLLPILTLFVGCTTTVVPSIDRCAIYNGTTTTLRNVELRHLPTKRGGGVSAILPGTSATVGFEATHMRATQAVMVWEEDGRRHRAVLELPAGSGGAGGGDATLVYGLYSGGRVTVRLQQEAENVP